MDWNEEQYERVARFLDGEELELTAEEQSLAEEIRADQAEVAAELVADIPARVADKAANRMHAALAGKPRRGLSLSRWLTVAAAAVVVIAVSVVVYNKSASPVTPTGTVAAITDEDVELMNDLLEEQDAEIAAFLQPMVEDTEAEDFYMKPEYYENGINM